MFRPLAEAIDSFYSEVEQKYVDMESGIEEMVLKMKLFS